MGGLVAIDEVSIVCMPDAVKLLNGDDVMFRDAQGKMIAHCESLGDRMCILDPPPDLIPQEILEWRKDTAGYDSKMAALYWPWIEVIDPLSKRPIMVPPSGHVAGVWARTDDERGVHKAPANEVVMGATALGFQLTSVEQGELNRLGINCIRAFSGRGIRVWGARTLSSDPEWRYINVRRLFNFVSQSLMEGTQWSVFEPNDERLWLKLRASVRQLPDEPVALAARCSARRPTRRSSSSATRRPTRPRSARPGQVICEIGISPVKPAEFVIFRLSQFVESGGDDGGRASSRRTIARRALTQHERRNPNACRTSSHRLDAKYFALDVRRHPPPQFKDVQGIVIQVPLHTSATTDAMGQPIRQRTRERGRVRLDHVLGRRDHRPGLDKWIAAVAEKGLEGNMKDGTLTLFNAANAADRRRGRCEAVITGLTVNTIGVEHGGHLDVTATFDVEKIERTK